MSSGFTASFAAAVGDRYRLEREIGRGGWGIVYLAEDLKHHRRVAVKLLRWDVADSQSRGRFAREIAIAANLHHPHIVPLFDSGEIGDAAYYVMPYLEGQTLLERIHRERQLPIAEALRIAGEVADALDHAHRNGVVHRDIKPSNILLSGGHALVADFGIARAAAEWNPASSVATSVGVRVGTPMYMAPEQASGDQHTDGRADLYSLGCVLYEMLAGSPPFSAATPAAMLARHALDPVPSLRTVRASLPEQIEAVILRALQKSPADRFQSGAEFSQALAALRGATPNLTVSVARRPARRTRWVGLAAAAVAVIAATSGVVISRGRAATIAAADTTKLVLLPVESSLDPELRSAAGQSLEQAVSAWQGIEVVVPSITAGEVLSGRQAAWRVAQSGAGRFVRSRLVRVGDGVQFDATLFDVRAPEEAMARGSATLRPTLAGSDSAMSAVVERLLFRSVGSEGLPDQPSGTRHAGARQAYIAGRAALGEWRLEDADSAFSRALVADKGYAQASLWLALARRWDRRPSAQWKYLAEGAWSAAGSLTSADSARARAIVAIARDSMPEACLAWEALLDRTAADFTSWMGSADCLGRDNRVVPAPRSPTGWAFRTSYEQAVRRYLRAFEMRPAVTRALSTNEWEGLRRILALEATSPRSGSSGDKRLIRFLALPSLRGDTLVFVPYPVEQFANVETYYRVALQSRAALGRQRTRFAALASTWVAAAPRDAWAHEALGFAQFLASDPMAVSSLQRARTLAPTAEDRARIAAMEAWILLLRGISNDPAALSHGRLLADSAMQLVARAVFVPTTVAAVGAVLGKWEVSDRIAPSARSTSFASGAATNEIVELLWRAALREAPTDSLRLLDAGVRAIGAKDQSTDATRLLAGMYGRSLAIAFPRYTSPAIATARGTNDYLLRMQAALREGDSTAVRAELARLVLERAQGPTAARLEALLPEARLWFALGDAPRAAAWLDARLSALAVDAETPTVAAGAVLRQTVRFRGELARHLRDDTGQRRWRAVATAIRLEAKEP